MVSKKQIANGIAKFIENDLMKDISDTQTLFVLSIAKDKLMKDAEVLDSFLNNSLIKNVIEEDDGMYDITSFADILKKVIHENEFMNIIIPSIPLICPYDKKIRITEEDIKEIVNYISPQQDEKMTLVSSI